MTSKPSGSLLLSGVTGFGLSLLAALPAGAHGSSDAGVIAGAVHPLLGVDHLLLLIGVGLTAAQCGPQLLAFAFGGAVLGSVVGSVGGHLPAAELLAALAVSSVGVTLLLHRKRQHSGRLVVSSVLAAAVAIHAVLHGQEASGTAGWWLGALLASSAAIAISYAAARQLNQRQVQLAAGALALMGGLLALAPL